MARGPKYNLPPVQLYGRSLGRQASSSVCKPTVASGCLPGCKHGVFMHGLCMQRLLGMFPRGAPLLPSTSALMTLPSEDSERLILLASLSRSPAAPVLLWRSLPAKSTRFSLPTRMLPLCSTAGAISEQAALEAVTYSCPCG